MKIKFISAATLLSASLFLLISCEQKKNAGDTKEATIDPKVLVSCQGIGEVKLTDSYQDLEKRFGAKSLSEHENNISGVYTSVWEQQPNQVNIYWKEKTPPFVHIKYMESVDASAPYMTKDSLMAGMTVQDIHKINSDMPLTFVNPYSASGDAGLVTSFNNGKLAAADPCLSGYVEVARSRNVDVASLEEFKKEPVIESSHKLLVNRMEVVFSRFRLENK